MKNGLPEAGFFEKAKYFFGWRDIFIIEGDSMSPTLKQGDRIFINRKAEPKSGDIVLFRHPYKKNVKAVKRLAQITEDGKYYVLGDNKFESNDSRSFGAIPAKDILGVAVCRFSPPQVKKR